MKKKYIVPNLTIVTVNTEQFIAASPDPKKISGLFSQIGRASCRERV